MNGPLDYAPPPAARPATPWPLRWTLAAALLLVGAILVALVLMPVSTRTPTMPHVRCQVNLRTIGQGLAQYAREHRGAMPADFAELMAARDLPPGVLICPASTDRPIATTRPAAAIRAALAGGGACSYVLVHHPGRYESLPPDAIVAFDASPRHRGGINAMFSDGSVEWIDAPASGAVLAAHAAGVRPLRVPPATTVPTPGATR